MAQESWETARRLLCIRLDSLGDVLMTTPALRALKQAQPGRHITLLTSPSGAAVAEMLLDVDECLVYEPPWMKHTPLRAEPSIDFEMIELLRQKQFDAAVIFTVFSQNPLPAAMLCYLAGIPRRLAYCRENPYQLLINWLPETEPQEQIRHEVRRQLDLVAAIGAHPTEERLSLGVPRPTIAQARSLLAEQGISPSRPWLVVHPGATASSRRYPPEMFSAALQELMERHHFQVVITGGQEELELVEAIQSRLRRPGVALAGQLTLAELAAVLSLAPVLLSNNTGPVHLAAAVGTPVVDLYALTNPQHTPWMVPSRVLNHDVPCKYCFKSVCPEGHHHCLRLVEPATVAAAVVDLYQQQRGSKEATEMLPPLQATCP